MTTALPLVTVTIPTFNQEKYVARAIESALAQDYPHLEIVVSDDHSTDDTFEIARSLEGNKVRVFRNDKNLGRVLNYRHALYDLAQGDWVVNLDGDDYYDDPTFISEAIRNIGQDPEVVMYAAGAKSLIEARGEIQFAPLAVPAEGRLISGVDYVLGYPSLGMTQHFTVLYNRAMAIETGFYILDSLGTDTDSLCRLALRGKVFVHGKYVGVWTQHQANASYTLTEATVDKEIRMLEHIAEALAGHVPEPVWRLWLEARRGEKRRFVENLTLSRLPTAQAWPYLWKRMRFERFYFREAAKLVLRSAGLRRTPTCAE